jgi:hypothetical protein
MNPDLSTGTLIVSIVAMSGWLFLNLRAMKSHQLGTEKTLKYAAAWIAIFALVAFVASRFSG